jgi:hypothetical protein
MNANTPDMMRSKWMFVFGTAGVASAVLVAGLACGVVRYVRQVDCKKRVAAECRRVNQLAICPRIIARECSASSSGLTVDWLLIYTGLGGIATAGTSALWIAVRR